MDHQFDESYPFVYIGHVWIPGSASLQLSSFLFFEALQATYCLLGAGGHAHAFLMILSIFISGCLSPFLGSRADSTTLYYPDTLSHGVFAPPG